MGSNPAAYRRVALWFALAGVLLLVLPVAAVQEEQAEPEPELPGLPRVSVPDEPFVINTHAIAEVRVAVVTKGLSHPWGMAFLPDGGILASKGSQLTQGRPACGLRSQHRAAVGVPGSRVRGRLA